MLGKPNSMTDEECTELPVARVLDQAGHYVQISCWQPSKEDLEDLANGGKVWLMVYGSVHPPVLLTTESPFL